MRHLTPQDHLCHSYDQEGERQTEADPESAGHVDHLRIGLLRHAHYAGLKRHAADGAKARLLSHDLGMHGAGIFGASHRGRQGDGLECHATLWAGTWASLTDLRMHRTGILDGLPCGQLLMGSVRLLRRWVVYILFRCGLKPCETGRAAEEIPPPLIVEAPCRTLRVHRHATDGVRGVGGDRLWLGCRPRSMMLFHNKVPSR